MTTLTGNTGLGLGQSTGFKAPKGYKSFQQYTPEAMNLYRSLFSRLGPDSYLSKLAEGDEELFAEMEEPAMRQLSQLQGGLASRFSGMGLGAKRSSGFTNALGQQATDFAKDLQAQRQNLQRQAIMDLMNLSSSLIEKQPYGLVKKQHKPKGWQALLGGLAPIVGTGAGAYFGGPAGAQAGYNIGSQFGNAFMDM